MFLEKKANMSFTPAFHPYCLNIITNARSIYCTKHKKKPISNGEKITFEVNISPLLIEYFILRYPEHLDISPYKKSFPYH